MRLILPIFLLFILFSCTILNTSEDAADHTANMMLWLESIQMENGLLPTYEYPYYYDGEYGTEVSLYDNALAVIAFVIHEDYERAEWILDFFNSNGEDIYAQFRYPYTGIPSTDDLWMGDNAWLLIAIKNYHHYTGNNRYQEMENRLEEWLISLQDDDGGLFAGYDGDGEKMNYKVIEGNLDAYNAVSPQGDFHERLLNYLNSRWDEEMELFNAWSDTPWLYAMDTTPWGYCTLPNMPETMLSAADRFLVTEESMGYCFDDDLDVIWFEGTAQMVVAYNKQQNSDKAEYYLNELEREFVYSPGNRELYGLPYSSNSSGTGYGDNTLWNSADKTPHISSTVWYIFGKSGFDPFSVGRN